jgi:hypothetical protein
MSDTFNAVKMLVAGGKVHISEHGYDELAADNILVIDVLNGVGSGLVIEDYPQFAKGPSVLVMQRDASGYPVHVLWAFQGVTRSRQSS